MSPSRGKPERAEDEDHAENGLDGHDRERHDHGPARHLVGPEAALEHERRGEEQHRAGEEAEVRHGDLDDRGARVEPAEDRPRHARSARRKPARATASETIIEPASARRARPGLRAPRARATSATQAIPTAWISVSTRWMHWAA